MLEATIRFESYRCVPKAKFKWAGYSGTQKCFGFLKNVTHCPAYVFVMCLWELRGYDEL